MAVTAKFQADFTTFYDAVQKADVQLKGLDTGAGKVSTSLTRMANSLNGTKLIQDATLMAAAVDKIGGVSKLTAAELQKVGAQAADAIAKINARGLKDLGLKEVPPDLVKIAQAADAAAKPVASLGSAFQSLGTTIAGTAAGFLSAQAIIGSFKAVVTNTISFASHLDDLQKASGLTTDALQALGVKGEEVGLTMDDIANAATQLSRRVAEGDASTRGAIDALGLSFNQLKTLSVDDQLISTAKALISVTDEGQRASIAQDLYGRGGIQLLRIIRDNEGGLDDLIRKMKEAGLVLSGESIVAIDKNADAWGRLWKQITVGSGEAIGSVFKWIDAYHQLVAEIDKPIAASALSKWVDEQKAALDKLHAAELPPVIASPGRSLPEPLTPSGGIDPSTKAFHDQTDALRRLIPELDKAKKALDEAAAAQAKWNDSIKDATIAGNLSVFTLNRMQAVVPDVASGFGELADEAKTLPSALGAMDTDIDALQRHGQFLSAAMVKVNQQFATLPNVVPGGTAALHGFRDEMEHLKDIFAGDPDFIGPVQAGVKAAQGFTAGFADIAKGIPSTLARAFEGGGGLEGAAKSLGAQLGDVFIKSFGSKLSAQSGGGLAGSLAATIGTAGVSAFAFGVADALLNPGISAKSFELQSQRAFDDNDLATLQGIAATLDHDIEAAHRFGTALPAAFEAARDKAHELLSELQAQQGASAFGPSTDELKDMADRAQKTFEFMRDSGKYSAAQVQAAWEAAQKAIALAEGKTATSVAASMSEGTKAALASLKELEARFKTLSDSVANEAPEEVMGVIESQTRGQMAALEEQSKQLREQLLADGQIAADELEQILDGIAPSPIHIPIEWDIPSLPGSPTITVPSTAATGGLVTPAGIQHFAQGGNVLPFLPRGTDTVPAMLTPGELVLNRNQQSAIGSLLRQGSGGGSPTVIHTHLYVDGREIAKSVDRYAAGSVQLRSKRPAA